MPAGVKSPTKSSTNSTVYADPASSEIYPLDVAVNFVKASEWAVRNHAYHCPSVVDGTRGRGLGRDHTNKGRRQTRNHRSEVGSNAKKAKHDP